MANRDTADQVPNTFGVQTQGDEIISTDGLRNRMSSEEAVNLAAHLIHRIGDSKEVMDLVREIK